MSTKATRKFTDGSLRAASRLVVETLEQRVLMAGDLPNFGPLPGSGAGPGSPAVGASSGVMGWTLLNADNNTEIATFTTGATINLRTLPTRNLNVRANTAGAQITGVAFALDGTRSVRTDTNGALTLFSDSGKWNPSVGTHTIMATPLLPGGGTGHSTAVQVKFVDQAGSQALGVSATSLDFGQVDVGPAPGVKQITLSNSSSNGTVTINSLVLNGANGSDFTTDLTTPKTLSPGQSIVLNVSFTPTADGNRSGTLVVNHSGTNNPLSISLAGVGHAQPDPSGQHPTLNVSDPAEGATGVRPDKSITLSFNLPNGDLAPSTVTPTNIILLRSSDNAVIPTNVTISGQSVVIDPTSNLDPSTGYTIQLSDNVRDGTGASLVPAALHFTTGTGAVSTQARTVVDMDPAWKFHLGDVAGAQDSGFDDSSWGTLSLPHTWNASDGQDGGSFQQGVGWYRKHITPDVSLAGQELFLRFDGAFLKTDVYVNGTKVGFHEGGFAAFTFDVTSALRPGQDNVVAVMVDNRNDADIAPIDTSSVIAEGPDFTFFGGLYRGVDLVATNPVHISLTDFGSPGIYLTQQNVSSASASVKVLSKLRNETGSARSITITADVRDANGQVVKSVVTTQVLSPGDNDVNENVTIDNPHLWNGTADPYMYDVVVTVSDGSTSLDSVTQPLGVRSFSVDPAQGFFLNGQYYDLHGVAYHQDEFGKGWAKSDSDTDRDIGLMQEMGVNYVRLVHYQHSERTYDDLDRAGIVTWTEIPWIYDTTNSSDFKKNLSDQLKELIRQNYNHPSIAFWGLWNGIEDTSLNRSIANNLNSVAHQEDPQRLTSGVTVTRVGNDAQINFIPDVIAYNDYFGWYRGSLDDFGPYADDFHSSHPDQPFGVSEFGAGANVNQHTEDTSAPDAHGSFHPEEYQGLFHEAEWAQMKNRKFLFAKTIFSMFDFAADDRNEGGIAGRNDKGLVTFDRQIKKDAFFFYKSNWTSTPTVYITSRRFVNRPDNTADVKIYSNMDTVELFVNGVSLGSKAGSDIKVFKWNGTNLRSGSNEIKAVGTRNGQTVTDTVTWNAP